MLTNLSMVISGVITVAYMLNQISEYEVLGNGWETLSFLVCFALSWRCLRKGVSGLCNDIIKVIKERKTKENVVEKLEVKE